MNESDVRELTIDGVPDGPVVFVRNRHIPRQCVALIGGHVSYGPGLEIVGTVPPVLALAEGGVLVDFPAELVAKLAEQRADFKRRGLKACQGTVEDAELFGVVSSGVISRGVHR